MMTKRMAAVAAIAVSTMAAGPAMADSFTFTFTAPLSNGDTASGSGTLTTAAPDASGRWLIQSVLGAYRGYASQPQSNAITNVRGVTGAIGTSGGLTFGSAYLFRDASGAIRTDGLALYNNVPFDGLVFNQRVGATYQGYTSEVSVQDATLTFTSAVTAAPEPATWAMMILGFGVTGAALRRRRKMTTRVAFA